MRPDEFFDKSGTSTGLRRAADCYVGRIHIICLDPLQRLPFNFAIAHNGYREFRTLAAARKYARSCK